MTAPLLDLDPDCLVIETVRSADSWTITVSGDIDATSAPAFGRSLRDVLDHPDVAQLLLDLTGVTFLDSAGLTALVVANRTAQSRGRVLSVRCGSSRAVRRPLEITGLLTILTVTDRPMVELSGPADVG